YYFFSFYVMIFVISFFFFFQAEDGIRDFHVTGVQTCALPISICGTASISGLLNTPPSALTFATRGSRLNQTGCDVPPQGRASARSEERRVGKEGRCRWGGDE